MIKKYKKIPISEFISDKKLSKIEKIIETSHDVDLAYDRIENLLDDFNVKDLGTNRVIFINKKKKYKDLIFKVAGDSHGIEANYREFYNGDLDKSLTYSYSISNNGVFLVQERVTPFNSKMMDKHKKDVRKMLHSLEKKILLVDCKLSNFKNFGLRDDGEVCLLDHGDTIPLPKHQTSNVVNVSEESNVSLRCKKFKDIGESTKKLEQCGGKLEYSKNYDYLICKKCNTIMSVNDAYKEFWGDKNVVVNTNKDLCRNLDFDPEEWKNEVRKYCQNTMNEINNDNEKGEEKEMTTKTINGKECKQIRGYWIPEAFLKSTAYAISINLVRTNKLNPAEFLKSVKLNPDEYKVMIDDHTPNEYKKTWMNSLPKMVNEIVKIINNTFENTGNTKIIIPYDEINNLGIFDISSLSIKKAIYNKLMQMSFINKVIYTHDKFIIFIEDTNHEDLDEPSEDDYNDLLGVRSNDNEQNPTYETDEELDDIMDYEEDDESEDYDNIDEEDSDDIEDDAEYDESDDKEENDEEEIKNDIIKESLCRVFDTNDFSSKFINFLHKHGEKITSNKNTVVDITFDELEKFCKEYIEDYQKLCDSANVRYAPIAKMLLDQKISKDSELIKLLKDSCPTIRSIDIFDNFKVISFVMYADSDSNITSFAKDIIYKSANLDDDTSFSCVLFDDLYKYLEAGNYTLKYPIYVYTGCSDIIDIIKSMSDSDDINNYKINLVDKIKYMDIYLKNYIENYENPLSNPSEFVHSVQSEYLKYLDDFVNTIAQDIISNIDNYRKFFNEYLCDDFDSSYARIYEISSFNETKQKTSDENVEAYSTEESDNDENDIIEEESENYDVIDEEDSDDIEDEIIEYDEKDDDEYEDDLDSGIDEYVGFKNAKDDEHIDNTTESEDDDMINLEGIYRELDSINQKISRIENTINVHHDNKEPEADKTILPIELSDLNDDARIVFGLDDGTMMQLDVSTLKTIYDKISDSADEDSKGELYKLHITSVSKIS